MHQSHPMNLLVHHSSINSFGGHILYIFNEIDQYVKNAVAFIVEGLKHDDFVLLADTKDLGGIIMDKLISLDISPIQMQNLLYVDTQEFYYRNDQFDGDFASLNLSEILEPQLERGCNVRTWGHVPLPTQSSLENLINYECGCNPYILNNRITSICAYSGLTTPAYIQNELLKTHKYFVTDDHFSLSPLYAEEHHKAISMKEYQRFKRIEQQNKYLIDKNSNLTLENEYMRMRHDVIKQSEKRLQTIINELPIPIVIRSQGDILYSNDLAIKQLHIQKQDSTKAHPLNNYFVKYDSKLNNGINKVQIDQFTIGQDKKKYYLVKSIDILFEGNQAILHSFVDITQEKENESLMVRSEKMNIAGELAASIAHELRNPLTSVKGFFHMLKNSNQGNDMYYNIIEDELSRIEQISSELLTLAKPHSENRKEHNIVQLINDVKVLLTSEANMKNIEIKLLVETPKNYISCEETKIKQVFINLIKNAIDAMGNGGYITIKVIKINEIVQIQVTDQGSGIPQEIIDKIGEPFYTTKEKGTGIGLMICYQIIERHGGSIDVDSQVGLGTTFTITLPITNVQIPA